jgi:alcohol dehydrogenase class IV
VFGEGALALVGQYSENFGAKKALIVTDPGVIEAGWTRKVEAELRRAGVAYEVFDRVTSNPKDHEAMAGVEMYEREKCDLIVAVGGGSPMDCAKGLGIATSNKRHVLDFEGVDEVAAPGPPLICIPTTAGSSADVSQFAIISDTVRKVKIAIISKTVVPDVALIDPITTTTMSPELTAATGMDALVHAFEAYVSNASSPLTDMCALEAIRLIASFLPRVMADPADMDYRGYLMLASLQAGLAFSNASLGLVHGMAHSLGGRLDLAHGACNSILLEHVLDFNYESAPDRYKKIAGTMGIGVEKLSHASIKEIFLNTVRDFRKSLNIDQTLSDFGVGREDIPKLSENALKDPCLATNPKEPTIRDIENIYEKAL